MCVDTTKIPKNSSHNILMIGQRSYRELEDFIDTEGNKKSSESYIF